jgi:type I restriction enzyme S subunit
MNNEKLERVPKLRFPEFEGMDKWEDKYLEKICQKISQGGTPDTLNPNYWNGNIEWLTPAEMGKLTTRFITSTNRKITETGLQKCSSSLLPINSVILSTRAPIGHLVINKSKMAINQGCKGLIPKKTTNHNYLYYSLFNQKSLLNDLGSGNTFKELSASTLKKIKIQLPKLPEQKKIANCLSSIDKLITFQTQKIDNLKTHKKGLMQHLFPAEGKTSPKLQFPEFEGMDKWEDKYLEKICQKISQGGTPDTLNPNYWNGNIEWLTPAEMGKLTTRFITSTNRKITETGLQKCSSSLLPINSVILSTRAPIGHLVINKSKMAINQGCKGLIPKKTTNHNYLYYSLFNQKSLLNDLGSGNTFKELSASTLKKIKIQLPKLPEQKKIANCLSSIDKLITFQAQKLDNLKTHKKGLMQQLFPAIN